MARCLSLYDVMHTCKINYHCYNQFQHHAKLHQYFLMPDTKKTKYSYKKSAMFNNCPTRLRYDTRCYFNVRSKADISQLNLPHGTDN